jgi:hypothetical protein
MLSDNEYQLLIYENIKYISENIELEDIVIIDNKFRSNFLAEPFPRDIILEYIKYICFKIDRDNLFDKNNILLIVLVIYNLIVKYYIDVSVYNSDICNYFKVDLNKFNKIEIKILELLDFNFNCINISKWIEKL